MKPPMAFVLSLVSAMFGLATPVRAASPLLQEATGLTGLGMFLHSGAPGMVLVVIPAAWSVLAPAHAIYRQRQTMPAAIGFDEAGPMAGIGLGWITMAAQGRLPMILQKSGEGGGFMTYIAFAPGRDVGAFVAVNRLDFDMFAGLTAAVNDMLANLVTR